MMDAPPHADQDYGDTPGATVTWSNASDWLGRTAAAGEDVIIPQGLHVILDVDTPPLGNLVVHSTLEFGQADVNVHASNVIVFGELKAGDAENRHSFDAKIHLSGDQSDPDVVLANWAQMGHHGHGGDGGGHAHPTTPISNKALIVPEGGKISPHGAEKVSWTQLGETADAGDTSITLVAPPTGWKIGDVIAIAPTGFEAFEAEERIVTQIDGAVVTFDAPLTFEHYGEVQAVGGGKVLDMRAEVANLSRNISIVGGDDSQGDQLGLGENPQDVPRVGYGGHTVFLNDTEVQIQGVEFQGLGNTGVLGNYPVHFHHSRDMEGSYITAPSIHHSFQRGLVVHRADNALIQGNVVYNTMSHSIYLEDGSETENDFYGNLAMLPRDLPEALRIDNPNATTRGEGRSSAYWITNAENEFDGNYAVGVPDGQGFWFVEPDNGSGTAVRHKKRDKDDPDEILLVDNNTAHTIGSKGGNLGYRFDWTGVGLDFSDHLMASDAHAKINNFTAWKIENFAVHIPPNRTLEFEGTVLADARVHVHSSKRGFKQYDGAQTFKDTHIVVQSDNYPEGGDIGNQFTALQFPGPMLWAASKTIHFDGGSIQGEKRLVTRVRDDWKDNLINTLDPDAALTDVEAWMAENAPAPDANADADADGGETDAPMDPDATTGMDHGAGDSGGHTDTGGTTPDDAGDTEPGNGHSAPEGGEGDTPQTGPNVKIFLFDARSDTVLQEVLPGQDIDIGQSDPADLTLVLEADGLEFGSVSLRINDAQAQAQVKSFVPYTLFGDTRGDLKVGDGLADGANTLSYVIHSGPEAQGETLFEGALSLDIAGHAAGSDVTRPTPDTDGGEGDGPDLGGDDHGGPAPAPKPLFREAEDFDVTQGVGIYDKGATVQIGDTQAGEWVRYDAIDFGTEADKATLTLKLASKHGGAVEIRICAPDGALIGAYATPGKGGRTAFESVEIALAPVAGVLDQYFVFDGAARSVMDMDHFEIKGATPVDPVDPAPVNTAPVVAQDLGDVTLEEGASMGIDLARVFADADPGDGLSYRVEGPHWVSVTGKTLALDAPQVDEDTAQTLTVTATDTAGASVQSRFTLRVTDAPPPPPVDAPSVPNDGTPISLIAEANTFSSKTTAAQAWSEYGTTLRAFDALGKPAFINHRKTNPNGNPQPEDGVGARGVTDGVENGSRNTNQTSYIRELGASERVVIDFAGGVADVTFQVGHLGPGEGPKTTPLPETSFSTALDESGQVIATGLIGPAESVDGLEPGSHGISDFAVAADKPIHALVLEAIELDHGNTPFDLKTLDKPENSSVFTLRAVTYTRVEDGDGGTGTDASGTTGDPGTEDPVQAGDTVTLSAQTDGLSDNGDGTKSWGGEINIFAHAPNGSTAEVVVDREYTNVGLGV